MSSTFAASLERLSDNVNRLVEIAAGALVALTVGVTFIQVVFRYGLDSSLSWSEEAARYCFIWTIFLGTSMAARRGQHIVVEVLAPRMRRALTHVVALVGISFFALFAYVAALLVDNAWSQTSTALQIPIALVYASAPLGAALTVLHLVNAVVQRRHAGARSADQQPLPPT